MEKIIPHDFGVAVIKEAVAKRPTIATERFHAPLRPASTFVRETASNYPKSWAGVVSGMANQTKDSVPKKSGSDGAIGVRAASVVPRTPHAAPACAPAAERHVTHPIAQISTPVAQPSDPVDLVKIMTATIEAALKPLREQLEATIVPMQRTIESLQAEFVAMREEKNDEAMQQAVCGVALETQDAKRLTTGNAA